MFESSAASFSVMAYREAGSSLGFGTTGFDAAEQAVPILQGVPEEEVARRISDAVERARAEARAEHQSELRSHERASTVQMEETLRRFAEERTVYFERLEMEVVRLALSIARKILEREAQVDPALLGALVRIALERMQTGPFVRVHVAPSQSERWRGISLDSAGTPAWQIVEDDTLSPGDCLVETEMGSANFGFDAQIAAVEEVFTDLLARRPGH